MALDGPSGVASPGAAAALFQQGVGLHGRGQLAQAESVYREALRHEPSHFDALHLLGVICHQTGRHEDAARYIRQAIGTDPAQPAAHSNLGLALQALRRPDEALECFDRAVALSPGYAEALNNRGISLRDLGRAEEAVESYDRSLSFKPDSASALNNRGIALGELRRWPEAVDSYDRALILKPDYAQAHLNRGIALLEMGRAGEALAGFERALQFDPDDPAALCNRGNALQALKRHAQALESYERAIARKADFAEAFNNRGNALRDLGRMEEALASFDRALALKPGFKGALNNRAIVLRELNRPEAALDSCQRALALDPDYVDALCNRGNILQDMKRFADALESYASALRVDPAHAESHWNEALCRLLTGDFDRGWEKYEWRWKTAQRESVRDFAQPLWLGGDSLAGKTIFLHAEQGLGDTIQFCRYAKMLAACGANVVLEVQKPLKVLLGTVEGVSRLLARGEPLPEFDCHCPLLSLPYAFRTTLATIPAAPEYLRCNPDVVGAWRERLGPRTVPRVGLVWRASTAGKSVPLAELLQCVTKEFQFFSLQQDVPEEDQGILAGRPEILRPAVEPRNFADAPLVELMDLVITVDTSIAHLAGAMGRPVWIMLGSNAEWRWMLDRRDSPWYPSARLYRASAPGHWRGVISRIRESLRAGAWASGT